MTIRVLLITKFHDEPCSNVSSLVADTVIYNLQCIKDIRYPFSLNLLSSNAGLSYLPHILTWKLAAILFPSFFHDRYKTTLALTNFVSVEELRKGLSFRFAIAERELNLSWFSWVTWLKGLSSFRFIEVDCRSRPMYIYRIFPLSEF